MIFLPMERRGLHPSKTQSKQPSALRTNSLTGFDLGDPACAAKSAPTCEDQHTRLGMFLLFLQIFIELAKLGSDRVSRRRQGPRTHNGRSRATASPPGLQRLSLLCRMVIKQDSGANIFPAEKRSQIHRCFLALAAVQAQQILHVQVLQSVSECTQDGGKVCGKSGGSAAVKEELEPDHLCQAAHWPKEKIYVVAVRLFYAYFVCIVTFEGQRNTQITQLFLTKFCKTALCEVTKGRWQLRQVSDNTLSQVLTEYVEAANRGLNMLVSRRYFFSCCSTNSKFPLVAY